MELKSKLKTITALLVFAVYLFTNQAVTAQMIYTYASEAAKEKLTYEELIEHGDLSGDNEINVYDVRRAKVALLNNEIPSPDGDVNNDGEFSQADMQVLQDYVLMRDIWKYKDKEKTDDPAVSVNTELEYPVFSSDDGDSISITAESININQDVASNGNVSINGEYREDFPHIKSNVGLDPFYMDYALYNAKFSDSDIYDVFSDEINFIVEKPLVVHSDIDISKEITVSSAYMMSYNDININNGSINFGDAVLYSKYGDITIDSDAINLVGLIYAPNGSVKLTGNHVHVNGYIIAKNVIIESERELNIDPSRPLSDILGTASVEAEELSILFEEWEYIEKDENEVFPEIVKAQIYNNPLSVDDAWLTENYGEEVVKAYNKDMKKELVEALYIGQSEGIANYHDIVFTLDFAARYDLFEKIRLVTELPDNEPGKITIKFGEATVRTIRVAGSDFVGPLPYGCQYRWDFFLDANENPELKGADPEDTDKKEYPIHDLPEFTKLVSGGATILEGTIGAAAAGISGLAASIAESIRNACVKAGADKIVETARDTLNSRLGGIADSSLYRKTETALTGGRSFKVGDFDFNVYAEQNSVKVDVYLNGEKVDLEKLTQITDVETLRKINDISEGTYAEIVNLVNSDSVPNEITKIIDTALTETDKYKIAYSKLNDIQKAYNSVTNYNKHIAEYNSEEVKRSINVSKTYGKSFSDSDILREELKKCGVTNHDYCNSAHHVVPKNMKAAKEAREILEAYDIELNSAANGVLLPISDEPYVVKESYHSGGHTEYYCEIVNSRLRNVVGKYEHLGDERVQKELCEELTKIKIDLFSSKLSVTEKEPK